MTLWNFTNRNGDFVFTNPEKISRLYFPLANEAEFMSSITPELKGDIKTGQNHFLLQPVTTEDLYSTAAGRNFWVCLSPALYWPLNGTQISDQQYVTTTMRAGILWQTITRIHKEIGLQAEITNFVPVSGEHVELMSVKITNISARAITFTPTSAIPIFGRSADNLRDHRHVTSLLNRVKLSPNGIIVTPEMSFDERGHKINHVSYFILGCDENGEPPIGQFPTIESFIGEGGSLFSPRAVTENYAPLKKIRPIHHGKETIGALRFKSKTLIPDESITYIFMLGIAEHKKTINSCFKKFNNKEKLKCALTENIDYWKKKIDLISFCTGNNTMDNWLRWVTLQPVLRKIFGCSFLPDFDYGRGGKGWRDLWQDCLTLLLAHPQQTRDILIANFSGIRIDGTNATIITKKPGYFIADRNKIARVWMDHGIWPFFTLHLYIHQTGDFDVLFAKKNYFYDQQLSRAQEIDHQWNPHHKHSKHLHTKDGHIYHGTILEHILVQHLVQFFNVGKHNIIRLEDADWNDGLDMAKENGESVAFTCFYARNLYEITMLLLELKKKKKRKTILLAKELLILLDRLHRRPLDYNSVMGKKALLKRYFNSVRRRISGKKVAVQIDDLIIDLSQKWQWLFEHVRRKEWISLNKNSGLFNGYYNNKGKRVEGKINNSVRMTLTGQVFPILNGIASKKQIALIYRAACKYLKDKKLGGFRLNTNFKDPHFDLGRAFAFAYGEKENGAIFSHMCVMFANALYQRNFVKEGYSVLKSLCDLATNTKTSKIYPCLPEYFNLEGRGMYSYLTGSASWYIMTMLTEVFGIKGHFGDLVIEPKLTSEQFSDSDTVSVSCYFAERRLSIVIQNPQRLDFGKYKIDKVKINPDAIPFTRVSGAKLKITRKELSSLTKHSPTTIEITLA
ncbi:MAG: cellobiose phosphorylase [Candidatus Omnitrophica bacterium]|nr:cellobiose phosphorylase [Candidatus Omnitrophota bacterium]MBU4478310.1 cellobiose phosphorylase [Candidatus Omnitrophota bacterium]MCG2703451.1 cellobiose phosphorylase [Candidatus Omnitrophota bacterium]